MANIKPTSVLVGADSRSRVVTWAAFTHTNNDSDPFQGTEMADRSVQVTGTFDSATVTISGSNDGTNYVTLHDPLGNNLTFAAAGLKQILETTLWIKVTHAGGTATENLTVTLVMHGKR